MLTIEQPRATLPSPGWEEAGPAAGPVDIAVVVDHVTKRFEHRSLLRRKPDKVSTAVDDVSFRVARNEIFGILGANGSGKSTLIRLMSTLLIADAGEIRVFGYDVRDHEMQVKRLINRVSVEASFFKKLSPQENLRYALRLYGHAGPHVGDEIKASLTKLGIEEEKIGQPLEQLSRGMQQKVAIARAFLTSPVLLLLDEPTTGLDPRSKIEVQAFVRRLRDEHDATILLCTHDMNEAEELCERMAILDRGRLVALDTVAGLKARVAAELGQADPTLEEVFIHLTGRPLDEADEESADDD